MSRWSGHCANWAVVPLLLITWLGSRCFAQQVAALPSVNLGDTSFLDGIALPGGVVELIGQAAHDGEAADSKGTPTMNQTDVDSGALLTHVAWISHKKFIGAWYGAEVVLSAAYVDTSGHGIGRGVGDVTTGPVVLQWAKHRLLSRDFYQRFVLDVDVPVGQYSESRTVNIGSHAWDVHPYYAFTFFPMKRIETSWRVHYLWNGVNNSPATGAGLENTQAGQAIHFNATAAIDVGKHVYVGANGYYLAQITDARSNGIAIPASREQIGAIGPGMVFNRQKWFYLRTSITRLERKKQPQATSLSCEWKGFFSCALSA